MSRANRMAMILLASLLGPTAVAHSAGPAIHPADTEATTDFSRLRAELTLAKKVFLTGEPVWADFSIRNTSDRPIAVRVPFENEPAAGVATTQPAGGLPLEHVFSAPGPSDESRPRRALVVHPDGDMITMLDEGVTCEPAGPVAPITIAPGGIVGLRLDLARYYPSLRTPGRHVVQWRPYGDALRSNYQEITIMAEETAVLETSMGDIRLVFFYEKAPNHVANFLELARQGFYNGTLFHRVIDGFMVQGGDPLTTDPTRQNDWGTGRGPRTLPQEFNNTPHTPGVLSMARGPDVNSASCQFFIVTGQASHLNGQYSAFGKVADDESLKVALRISKAPRDPNDRPLNNVTIKRVRVEPAKAATTQPQSPPK